MPITYSIDRERAVIFEQWIGNVSVSDLRSHWTLILSDPRVMAVRRTVVDMRNATIAFTGPEMEGLVASVVVPVMKGRNWVTAIVVGHPVQVGISNQYRVYADSYSKDATFTNADEATAWLMTQPIPD
jgi:hypothetical protein